MKIMRALNVDAERINEVKTKAYRDEKKRFGYWKNELEGPKWYYTEWYNNIEETKRVIELYHQYKILINEDISGCFFIHDIEDNKKGLEDFCIDPVFQGKGYGYKSLVEMEKLYPSYKHWLLSTPAYSVRNRYLYEKFGYRKTGEKNDGLVYIYEKIII